MKFAGADKQLIPGAAGVIETAIHEPEGVPAGIALIAHPHPLHGGNADHKVVVTLAKTFVGLGHVALRPNFRGVGQSAGGYDEGRGETEDMLAVARYALERYGTLPLVLAGFSFGAFVQSRVAKLLPTARLVLVGPATRRFDVEKVPTDTLVIHGEQDEVIPLADVLDWARPQHLPVIVLPGTGHFFHGRLHQLQQIITQHFR
ncbi:MAG: alpha/beta fold hydrolase [Pseudomonadota bacterium]